MIAPIIIGAVLLAALADEDVPRDCADAAEDFAVSLLRNGLVEDGDSRTLYPVGASVRWRGSLDDRIIAVASRSAARYDVAVTITVEGSALTATFHQDGLAGEVRTTQVGAFNYGTIRGPEPRSIIQRRVQATARRRWATISEE